MPKRLKIGFTKNTVEQRVAELSNHSGVPLPFVCIFFCRVRDPETVEGAVHEQLACFNAGKDFFEVGLDVAIATIEKIALNQNSHLGEKWRHPKYSVAPATPPSRRSLDIAPGQQLTPEIVQIGYASASTVWVPLKGHKHENR